MKTILLVLLILSALINFFLLNFAMQPVCGACEQKDAQIKFYYEELRKCNSDTCHKWCIKLQ